MFCRRHTLYSLQVYQLKNKQICFVGGILCNPSRYINYRINRYVLSEIYTVLTPGILTIEKQICFVGGIHCNPSRYISYRINRSVLSEAYTVLPPGISAIDYVELFCRRHALYSLQVYKHQTMQSCFVGGIHCKSSKKYDQVKILKTYFCRQLVF